MSPNAPQPRGRPTKHIKDSNGQTVVGLSAQIIRNKAGDICRYVYYATKSKPRKKFGSNLDEAIIRFRRWQSENKDERIIIEEEIPWGNHPAKKMLQELLPHRTYTDTYISKQEFPEALFWEKVAEVFSTQKGRDKAARMTGYEQLKQLDVQSRIAKPLTLAQVGELYTNTDSKELGKALLYWGEFCKAVMTANVNQVTRDDLIRYRNAVVALKLVPRTVLNRYRHISAILNNAKDRRPQHKNEIETLKDSFKIICKNKQPDIPEDIPTPIEPEDYKAMLEAVTDNSKWKAIILLSLNCGLHPGECHGLVLDDLDLKNSYLWDNRNKNKRSRCSMLWKETIEAVQAYIAEYQPTEYLFYYKDRETRHNTSQFGGEFKREVLKPANVSKITFEWLRDSGTNAASMHNVDMSKVQMWLGQTRGELQKYDPSHPIKTQPVVDAIYADYMQA